MGNASESYDKLINHQKKTALLSSCVSILGWDRETYMPPNAAPHRAEQLTLLSSIVHERATDPHVGDWLADCECSQLTEDPLTSEAVNIREIRRSYDKKTKVPKRLVEELTRTTSLGHQAWIESREKSNFTLFLPWLEKIVQLKREYAAAIGYEDVPYDALLDDYEPGESTATVTKIFTALSNELVPIIQRIIESPHQPDKTVLSRRYPLDKQRIFGEMAAASIGFNFNAGRLDTVVHPFCTGLGPSDTRITTRWDDNNFGCGFFGILHETGHGLYDQGVSPEHWGTPMGSSVSLGIHESQSRLWENIVGRSRPFWKHFYPKLQAVFQHQLSGVSLDNFVRAVNEVCPSYIRVEADEATYTLHIVLRFEIEQALISGDLQCADVPGAWNEKVKKLLGLEFPDDANGCLQDVHWSLGSIGYFPTYALGNLYAAQLYDTAKKEISGLEDYVASGDHKPLLSWLRHNIHSHGMRFRAKDLVTKISGKPLHHDYLISYLNDKYSELY